MWHSIPNLKYRVQARVPGAAMELSARLQDRLELPLPGLHGEKLYLTGISRLRVQVSMVNALYHKLPAHRVFRDSVMLDAWSSATIEGARTTVAQVKQQFFDPRTQDDRMVINTVKGCNYAYGRPITRKNIRRLWERVVDGVCGNAQHRGDFYRSGMVVVGSPSKTIHTPAEPAQIPGMMDSLFSFLEAGGEDLLLCSFAAHFYFVYVHPFCDGNGRTARILNAAQLYHGGYSKMRSLPLSSAINSQLSGYYKSLEASETVLVGQEGKWLDLSPFVSYMLDAFEQCLINAGLSQNVLTDREKRLLERMNKNGTHAEITAQKAAAILGCKPEGARTVLNSLLKKGYLTVNTDHSPYIYRLDPQFPMD